MNRPTSVFASAVNASWLVILASALLASGCASITTSDIQSVMVTARLKDGAPVAKAECKLTNDKGAWSVTSPGSVAVRRSADDMQIECSKDGVPKGMAKAISRAHGGMFGNIIFGGGIGAIIDHSRGAGYDYPDVIDVVMGASLIFDRREQQTPTQHGPAQGVESRPVAIVMDRAEQQTAIGPAIADATHALQGNWVGTMPTQRDPLDRMDVQLLLGHDSGTWRMTVQQARGRANACNGRDFPVTVRSASRSDLSIQIHGNKVLQGCLDQVVSFRLIDGNTLDGQLDDGRTLKLLRQ